MIEIWYGVAAVALAAYVVLDGFDLGAGLLHLFVAVEDGERRTVLAAIGPLWDGNEVWLLAAGGVLFLAFPAVLAAALSGLYLAIFLFLWALILRGISIELRSHVAHPLWREFWDWLFAVASLAMTVLLGAALGNLLRGVPIDETGYFQLPLFTDFSARQPVGILDWYTVLTAAFATAALGLHGALFLWWKSSGAVEARSRAAAPWLAAAVAAAWPVVTWATVRVHAGLFTALAARPAAWLGGALAVAGATAVAWSLQRGRARAAFLGSCAFLAGVLGATAASVFPVLLRSTAPGGHDWTAYNAAAAPHGLGVGLGWLAVAAPLAIAYFVLVFRLHRGKVAAK